MSTERIHFFAEDIAYRIKHKMKLRKWLKKAITEEKQGLEEISYIFCSDAYLLEINQTYLKHDTYTDIITFDNSSHEGKLAGDIYISVERLRENAAKYGVSEEEELLRLLIHGVLHLCGYRDKKAAEKALMQEKEDQYIQYFKNGAL